MMWSWPKAVSWTVDYSFCPSLLMTDVIANDKENASSTVQQTVFKTLDWFKRITNHNSIYCTFTLLLHTMAFELSATLCESCTMRVVAELCFNIIFDFIPLRLKTSLLTIFPSAFFVVCAYLMETGSAMEERWTMVYWSWLSYMLAAIFLQNYHSTSFGLSATNCQRSEKCEKCN